MAKLLSVSVDVSKIDKSKLIKGKKGSYANITISVNDEDDQFGNNVSLWEAQTEEQRKAKENRNFLGNGKIIWSNDPTSASDKLQEEDGGDDLPF